MFNLKKLLSIFFPERCPFCNKVVEFNEVVCKDCKEKINLKITKNTLRTRDGKEFICVSPFLYAEPIRSAIHEYKFRGVKNFVNAFGVYSTYALKKNFDVSKIDIITSVPLHKIRKRERGFNQSELFAKKIGYLIGASYIEVLKKVKNNKIQHELKLDERVENVKDVYSIEEGLDIRGKIVVICDDILTTGSTMAECAKVVFDAGAKEVIGVTVAAVENKLKIIDKKYPQL